jgi:hypothetical protein
VLSSRADEVLPKTQARAAKDAAETGSLASRPYRRYRAQAGLQRLILAIEELVKFLLPFAGNRVKLRM